MTYKENITAILECYFTGFKKEIIDSACNRILEQEPSRKKGKWIEIDDYPNEEYECSICGRIVEVTSANIKPEEEYPYCHCGADMREVEE